MSAATVTNGTGTTKPNGSGGAQAWRTWTPERKAKFQKTMAAKRREREREAKTKKAPKAKKPTKHARAAADTHHVDGKGARISDAIAYLEEARDTDDREAARAFTVLALKRLQGRI